MPKKDARISERSSYRQRDSRTYKVDVDDLPRYSVKQQVRRMAISQSKNVADHARRSERADIGRPSFDPRLRVPTLEPEDSVEVLSGRVFQRILEDLDLLHEREVVVVGSHLKSEGGSATRSEGLG